MKLMEPIKLDRPARCKAMNKESIDEPFIIERGTQKVQPEFTPPSINNEHVIRDSELTNTYKDIAFNLGKIISEQLIIKGIRQLPKEPIKIGMIMKKIINNPWKVIAELYCIPLKAMKPGNESSNLIAIDKMQPIDPPKNPKLKYCIPINT